MKNYSSEYISWINSKDWKVKSRKCQALTIKSCILFPWLDSRHTHHLTYRNMKSERPIRDTVPLSVMAHKLIHLRIFWKTGLRKYINYFLRFLMILSIIFWQSIGRLIK